MFPALCMNAAMQRLKPTKSLTIEQRVAIERRPRYIPAA